MQTSVAVDRARTLWAEGRRRDAIVELRTRVRKEPGDAVARLLLASWYREVRAPDQAARWGIALPDWTTARERELLARLIASSGVRDEHLARFLALPAGERPPELDEVMVIVGGLRAPDGWRGAKPLRRRDRRSQVVRTLHVLGWLLLGSALLMSGLVALTGDSATSLARGGVSLALLLLAAATVVEGTRPRPGWWWAGPSAVLLAAALTAAAVALARMAV
ncbi:membrane protein [Clavibacter michiganensis]|uniref:Membrane protein n=1 Tax=Clavibacter michiganensis subsp. insidiosus TaxID=33014 RepID=A0A0D5CEX5_9MICO|nr:membrane protein [Clavibacter michiganensis]AJW78203.1 membrane protein [Clavibacter michiganensis subsp. insidiosus]AWF99394.1 membrane protein [Clavibacter michiganensis subsp. insidiosus]